MSRSRSCRALAFPGRYRTRGDHCPERRGPGGTVILRDAVGQRRHPEGPRVVINCQGLDRRTQHRVDAPRGQVVHATTRPVAGGGHYCEVGSRGGSTVMPPIPRSCQVSVAGADPAMFHRNADGSEGGIVAFTSAAGRATASDVDGSPADCQG